MSKGTLPARRRPESRLLTQAEFQHLKDVPPESDWFANLNSSGTRRMYQISIREFMRFTGIARPEEFRQITRAHVIAWRKSLMTGPSPAPPSARHWPPSPLYMSICAIGTPSRSTP
jgi:integrase/recombinase XerD